MAPDGFPNGVKSASPASQPAYDAIDAIRALAALAVVWNHVWNLVCAPFVPAFGQGWRMIYVSAGFGRDAVMVFFVISGFWITHTIVRRLEKETRFHWREYMVDRVARLWVVVVPVLLVGGALDIIGRHVLALPLYAAVPVIDSPTIDIGLRLTPWHAVASLFFFQDVLIAPFGSNAPLWSLANEFWYYIWFPILLILFRTRKFNLLLLAVLVVSAIVCRALLPLFSCWLLGSAVFFGVRWAQRKGIAVRHGRLLVLSGFSAFLIGEAAAHVLNLPYLVSAFGIALGFAIFLTTLLITRTGLPSLFSGVARYGAEASFSLYVAHYPLLLMAVALSTPGAGQAPGLLPLLYSLALMAGLVLAGWLVSWLTERNTAKVRAWARGLFARRDPPAATAVPVPAPAHEQ